MLYLLVLMLLNGLAHNEGFILEFRLEPVPEVPINILDGVLAVGLFWGLFRFRQSPNLFTADQVHPLFRWLMMLFIPALIFGSVLGLANDVPIRRVLTMMRNFAVMPVSVFIGYAFLGTPKAARWIPYIYVFAGLGAAMSIMLFFKEASHDYSREVVSLSPLRTISYVSNYAGLGVAIVLFSILVKVRLFPLPLALLIGGISLIGQFATLSRSDWLACIAGMLVVYYLLPPGERGGRMITGVFLGTVMALALWIGIAVASQTTGVDFTEKMNERFWSLLPESVADTGEPRAWHQRLPATVEELKMWSSSPLIGRGFAIQDGARLVQGKATAGYRHNTWISTLAETGLLGFSAMALVVGGSFAIGRRMVREQVDAGSVLIGGMGVITAAHYFVHGICTMSFNQMRFAIPLGVVCGLVLRCRAMQQTIIRRAWDKHRQSKQVSNASVFPGQETVKMFEV